MNFNKDFSKKAIRALNAKGYHIIGVQAIPMDETDKYFTGIGYKFSNGQIKTFKEVLEMIL